MQRVVVGLIGDHHVQACDRTSARELFQAPLVQACVRYCETFCDDYAFISAKHVVLMPETQVDPYSRSLKTMKLRKYMRWASAVDWRLSHLWPGAEFVVLASDRHVRAVRRFRHVVPWGSERPSLRLDWIRGELDEEPVSWDKSVGATSLQGLEV